MYMLEGQLSISSLLKDCLTVSQEEILLLVFGEDLMRKLPSFFVSTMSMLLFLSLTLTACGRSPSSWGR